MTLVRRFTAGWAFALLLLAPQAAPAAWDNVFQVTCCHKKPVTASYYAAPVQSFYAPAPSVAYVQRSFYQPVTSYVAETHYEPVTSYRTSYYWEPVVGYTYSSYQDPCGGCPQQIATPTTSYRLRQQCNAVTNYAARVSYKPVVSYRQSCYMEAVPVDPCGHPAVAAPVIPGPATPIGPGSTPPPPLNLPAAPGAGLDQRSSPPAGGGAALDTYSIPPITNPSYQRNPTAAPPASPAVRPERIASRQSAPTVTGQVGVRNDYVPRPGAKVVFVNASRQDVRQAATADFAGRFQVNLASGKWYVYVDDGSGQMTYHNQYDVSGQDTKPVTVVSR